MYAHPIRALALAAAALLAAGPAAAQYCLGTPSTAKNLLATGFSTGDLGVGKGSLQTASVTFARRAFRVESRDLDGTIRLTGAMGGIDDPEFRDPDLARGDGDYTRLAGEVTLERMRGRLSVCATTGVTWAERTTDEPVTRSHLTVPLTISAGFAEPVGNATVIPYVAPTIAYFDTEVEDPDGSTSGYNGRDLSIETGVSVLFRRVFVGGAALFRRQEFDDETQFLLRAGLLF